MGEFFNSIADDLNALDGGFESDYGAAGTAGAAVGGATFGHEASIFGSDYNANPAVVRQVQQAVNAMGYSPALAVDGAYGPMTAAGVKWAQAQKGLTADGIIGDQTLGALGITPPSGTSVQSVEGTVTGALTGAAAALQQEFAPLISWATEPSNAQPITQGSGIAPGFQATKASVVNSFVNWTKPLEGWVPWMYLDALGFVTTGLGNKIDPESEAFSLPWKNADGSPASQAQIAAAWQAVDSHRTAPKGQKQPGLPGGGEQGGWSSLRIDSSAIQKRVEEQMKSNEGYPIAGLPGFAQAPADAQLAAHSMAWAMGPRFASTWTAFRDAFNRGDYQTAADQSHMQGVGIDMRNMANKLLLTNAAQVRAKGYNPDHLYYLSGLTQLFQSPSSILGDMLTHKKRTALIVGGVAAVVGLLVALMLAFTGKHAPQLSK